MAHGQLYLYRLHGMYFSVLLRVSLDVSQPNGPPRSVRGIALPRYISRPSDPSSYEEYK
jgi:hypothetical protein